ncbi:MAG: hypothetical protein WCC39_09280, partial [Telluria sp.]
MSMSTTLPEPNTRPALRAGLARWLMSFAAAALVSFVGLKRFEPWDQVMDLWEGRVSPLLLAVTGHPHFFRYLTAYPGFLWEESYPDVGFSLYISLFLAFNVVLWRGLSLLATGRAPTVLAWFGFFAIHFFMNGRGVIAWTSWLLCLSLCLQLTRGPVTGLRPLLLVALSCWLAAVSTGVFIVVVASFVLFYLQYRQRTRMKPLRKTILLIVATPVIFYIAQYLLVAIQKNIDFFGGGFEGVYHMLAHGLGRVLFGNELLAVVLVAAAAFSLLFLVIFVRMRNRPFTPVEKLIALA